MIVRLLLFATAREAAGRSRDDFELAAGASLEQLLTDATARYGDSFARVLGTARVWVNGEEPPAGSVTELGPDDEIAVLPPVSGGACDRSVLHIGDSLPTSTARVGGPIGA